MNCASNSRARRFAPDAPGDGELISIGPFYISKNSDEHVTGPQVILRHASNFNDEEPVLIKNGFQLSQTDVLIAALLGTNIERYNLNYILPTSFNEINSGVVLMLSVTVITLYCRWRHAVQTRRFQLRKMSLGGALPISVMR